MHGSSTSELETASPRFTWNDHNECGLASAAEGAWVDALGSFGGAADSLATESDVASHEALALVLNNLAHGCYRVGQIDDAIRHAQRACALRVALVGEDAISVSRARADLAVMLSATGRTDEAMTLITRAIAGIERSAGEEALQLTYVLENAARLAMSAGQPSTAEPYLLRLHALFAAHDLPTDRADKLLAGVAQHRATARVSFGLPIHVVRDEEVPDASAAVQDAIVEERSADVVVEDVIATDATEPNADPVIEAADVTEASVPDAEVVPDALDDLLGDISFTPATQSTDILGLDFELVDFAPAVDNAVASPAPPATVAPKVVDVLGFEVRYGTQTDEDVALANTVRPISTRIPTPPVTPAIPKQMGRPEDSDRRGLQATDDNTRERRIRRPNIRWG